jgi:hypothetical protein
MRLLRALVVAAVFGALGLGCGKDAKTVIPPPSPDDKPLGKPHGPGGAAKQRRTG